MLRKLEYLNVSHNRLTNLKMEALNVPQLKTLNLSYNQISNLTSSIGRNFTNFINIDLSSNNFSVFCIKDIQIINYNVTTNVQLDLRYNSLESVDMTDLETFVGAKLPFFVASCKMFSNCIFYIQTR